ncbi:MAG TPA: ATP-binding protein, partial [Leptospiraceae bacterium]|nr:ATP-binding protein [Leptospiraceae bacterium]
MEFNELEEIVIEQRVEFEKKDSGLERIYELKKYLNSKQITVLSGVRRSGKSTLLKQIADRLGNYYYLNFDDERLLEFSVADFSTLLLVWQKQLKSRNILLDEIQNIANWERFIRRIHDEGYKVFITGSNAKMLSTELATHLTGRYVKVEVYPFSFREMLKWKSITGEYSTVSEKAEIISTYDVYLKQGGFPDYIKYEDSEFLKRTYDDIIYKDIIVRFGIKEIKSFRLLSNYIFSNFTKEISFNGLKNLLGFKSSVTVRDYVSFLEESYLVFELNKYDFSLKKQYAAGKKIYVIDNGMREQIAFSNSEDRGRLLENLVFLELKKRNKEIYYFKNKHECDFIVFERNRISSAFQVTLKLGENKDRELNGLYEA